jgi:quinol monooxygenase YgiN
MLCCLARNSAQDAQQKNSTDSGSRRVSDNNHREERMLTLDRRTLVQGAAFAALIAAQPANAAGSGAIYIIAEIVSKPDKADELRALMVPFAEKARTEPGCQHYALLEVQSEPGRFLTYETWADKAAIDAHMKTPHIQEIIPKLGPILAKPFTQIFMNLVST